MGGLFGLVAFIVGIHSLLPISTSALYEIGVGIADVTGPAAEVTFMGYAKLDQKGRGIHLRQFSRAFIIGDGKSRIAFVSVDVGMIGHGVRKAVIKNLQKRYGNVYNEDNVVLSGTHTHSGPGGFLQYMLFDISILGFLKQSFTSLVNGISLSIIRAHENIVPGRIYFAEGELLNASINRSPTAYEANPEEERSRYRHTTDKQMTQLRMMTAKGNKPLGVINWFAVHPTSMNNSNYLISSDNVGYASILFEESMNHGAMLGKGGFVAAFASSNLGDVSPNIMGPRCIDTGDSCDMLSSTCNGETGKCISSGPGKDMFESTKIIAERMYEKALELFKNTQAKEIIGPVKAIHQFVDMPSQKITYFNRRSRSLTEAKGCLPAMGYSFGAGTTDGPGAYVFRQSTTTDNPLWNMFRNAIHEPSDEQVECQGKKPILLPTGEITFPYEWQPRIVSTQLILIGKGESSVAIAPVPGEFTTMAGRRLREAIMQEFEEQGVKPLTTVIAGLSNTYADYITTPEEYSVQRYEGASTIYGPNTLTIYLHQYENLAKALINEEKLDAGPQPPTMNSGLISLIPPVLFDSPLWRTKYGDVLSQPKSEVFPGDTVQVKFVSGHPRNNPRQEDTFLTVERKEKHGNWKVVATDANWSTKFIWERTSFFMGCSEATVEWTVDENVEPGEYRIRHFGNYKYIFGGIYPYEGISKSFQVLSRSRKE